MLELDHVGMSNDSSSTRLGDILGRQDLPLIIRIVVRVTSDLLTLRTDSSIIVSQGVLVDMRVQELLGILVLDRDRVKVSNFCHQPIASIRKLTLRIEKQFVALESLLESGRHECVSGSRVDENLEVDPEEQEVEEEWDDNETNDPVCEMSVEVGLAFQRRSPKTKGSTYHSVSLLDIQNLPQVIQDGSPDAHKGK